MFAAYGVKSSSQRADTLAIKAALSDLLPPEDGTEYWRNLGELLTGKITRDEWTEAIRPILTPEASRLHNQLILAILYNTTRASVAPPATSRHAGWNKRRREGDDAHSQLALALDPREAKRRRIKELVHSLGKRERKRIKSLALLGQPVHKTELLRRSFGTDQGAVSPANKGLQSELKRCQSAQLCAETFALPSVDTLRDRMACGAHTASLASGVEPSAASLLSLSLELYLRRILTGVIDIADRSVHPPRAAASADESTEAEAEAAPVTRAPHTAPSGLVLDDVATLFELSPQTFVAGYVGSVESHLSAYTWPHPSQSGTSDDDVLGVPSAPPAAAAPSDPPTVTGGAPAPQAKRVLQAVVPAEGIAGQRSFLPPAAASKANGIITATPSTVTQLKKPASLPSAMANRSVR